MCKYLHYLTKSGIYHLHLNSFYIFAFVLWRNFILHTFFWLQYTSSYLFNQIFVLHFLAINHIQRYFTENKLSNTHLKSDVRLQINRNVVILFIFIFVKSLLLNFSGQYFLHIINYTTFKYIFVDHTLYYALIFYHPLRYKYFKNNTYIFISI